MKTSMFVLCAACGMLFLQSPLAAQDTLAHRFGAGISIEPALFGQSVYFSPEVGYFAVSASLYSNSPYYVYLPVNLTRNIRVEPRFGIVSYSTETSSSNTPGQSNKDELTLTHVGLSIQYVYQLSDRFQIYAGPRGGLNFINAKTSSSVYPGSSSTTQTETDFAISGIFGGEYFPLGELSVGGEIDVNYVSFGNPEATVTPAPTYPVYTSTRTASLVSTGALFFLRWYFL